ncbi:MAG: glycosyltransferase family 2 protein [Acidimicrobiales bacterium]
MTAVDVTAIVPTYNRAEYLGACLGSILGQTRPPQQVIVVDDGSTDGTADVIRSYGSSLEHLRQEENAGKAAALNRALARARGEAIWIFDDDDVALPEALELLGQALAAHPRAGFAFGGHESFSAPDEPVAPRAPTVEPSLDLDDLFHDVLSRRVYVFQAATLVRRRCYDEVGPFDETFVRAQDFDMLTRLAARFEATQVDAVVFRQRQHSGDRGPAHLRIDGREVWDRQYRFDVEVARKVHRTMPLDVFLARRDRARASAMDGAALLRRSAVMLQWGLWDAAREDLRALATAPVERAVRSRIAVDFRMGAERLSLVLDQAPAVLDDARALPPGPVRDELVAVLLWPLVRQAAKAALRGRVRSTEAKLVGARRDLLRPAVLVRLGRVGAARVAGGVRRRAGAALAGRAAASEPTGA